MHIPNAPTDGRITTGCDVTLQFTTAEHTTREESYRITSNREEHSPENGVLWAGSCWGERLMGHSIEDVVSLPAPEKNIAEGKIVSIHSH